MLIVNELRKRKSMDDTNIHASVISGKVRISSFTITAEEGGNELLIAYLPAGRGRALPVLCRIETTGVAGDFKVGTGAYTSALPFEGAKPAEADNLCKTTTAADGVVKSFSGPVEGLAYHSLEDIPVIFTGPITTGDVIKGLFVYNVT